MARSVGEPAAAGLARRAGGGVFDSFVEAGHQGKRRALVEEIRRGREVGGAGLMRHTRLLAAGRAQVEIGFAHPSYRRLQGEEDLSGDGAEEENSAEEAELTFQSSVSCPLSKLININGNLDGNTQYQ